MFRACDACEAVDFGRYLGHTVSRPGCPSELIVHAGRTYTPAHEPNGSAFVESRLLSAIHHNGGNRLRGFVDPDPVIAVNDIHDEVVVVFVIREIIGICIILVKTCQPCYAEGCSLGEGYDAFIE